VPSDVPASLPSYGGGWVDEGLWLQKSAIGNEGDGVAETGELDFEGLARLKEIAVCAALDPVLFREWTRWLGIDTFGLRRPGRGPSSKEER